ncbi:hypothetical protein F5Y09DRAFT_142502 [Xylaria sp. FL1042]|nr:hypothetical protein F5Y09DRAFT_142502 [Xylaria sp. FL1042]
MNFITNTVVGFTERILETLAPSDLESHVQERCHPAPPKNSERWVAREKSYVPFQKPSRSVSVISSFRSNRRSSLPIGEFKPIPVAEEPDSPTASLVDSHDGDAEDTRNGVPTTYSQNQLRQFRAARKRELEAEFRALKLYSKQLSESLDGIAVEYLRTCRWFRWNFARHWTPVRWKDFEALEDVYFALQDELFDVQIQMQHKSAQILLYLDHTHPPGGLQYRSGDISVWSLEGAAESRVRNGSYVITAPQQVDHNHIEVSMAYLTCLHA